MFKYDRLNSIAAQKREAYQKADPFPHVVIDQAMDPTYAAQMAGIFPSPEALNWYKYNNLFEKKLAMNALDRIPKAFGELLKEFNSSPFVRFLEELTGIQGLIPDPHYRGGGLHQIERGGKLDIHADFNRHNELQLDRRLNVLLYLNPGWSESWGGCLELWDKDMTKAQVKISPVLNRMVVFSTTDDSFHGHPTPLTCPAGETRKSIALYYYTNGRPEHEKSSAHSTLYQRRPEDPTDPMVEEMRRKRAKGRLDS